MRQTPKKPTFLAFIPARSGSKRLPGKNLLDFMGMPMIGWSIEAVKQSQHINEVVVSTDDQDILTFASEFDIVTPHRRLKNLATDDVPLIDVALDYLKGLKDKPEYFLLLQPTSPLRTAKHIDEAVALLKNNDAVISVVKSPKPNEWSNDLPENMSMDNFFDESIKNKQTQDFRPKYSLNGAIYLVKTDRLIEECSFMLSSNTVAYEMSIETSIDIDTEIDLFLAKGFHMGLKNALKKLGNSKEE